MTTYAKMKSNISTKILVYYALLIALSFVGAQIKIFGSIALDALPAFFAALFLGPVAGAVIGALGHLLTAITSGFPMTVPIHLLIAICMAGICGLVGYLNGKINILFNSAIGILLNGVVATYISVMAMQLLGMIPSGNALFMILITPLTIASTVNVGVAAVLYKILKDKIRL